MINSRKKGFTLVELVIVIAVIAILAAVLIPTFSSLVKKANVSNDTALVKNLNTALVADVDGHETMSEVLEAAKEFGYDIAKIQAKADKNKILWDSKNDCFVYLDSEKGLIYIPDSKKEEPKNYELWVISDKVDAEYSTYLYGYTGATVEAKHGLDVGECAIEEVTYTTNATETVVINTNGGVLVIDAENATVNHYGNAQEVYVNDVAAATYNLYGNAGYIEVASGEHVVLKQASSVSAIVVNGEANVEISNGQKQDDIVYDSTQKDEVYAAATKFGGGLGTADKPYIISNVEHMENINDNYAKAYYYYKVADGIKLLDLSNYSGAVELNGSFDGNNVTFINAQSYIFKVVGTGNEEDTKASKLSNFEVKFEGGKGVVRNCGATILEFDNVNVSGYIVSDWNVGAFLRYGSNNVNDNGFDYTVNFKNCSSKAEIYASANSFSAILIGHTYPGTGKIATINVDKYTDENVMGTTLYYTGTKPVPFGYKYCGAGTYEIFVDGQKITQSELTGNNIVKIDSTKTPSKADNGKYEINVEGDTSKVVVSLVWQYTLYTENYEEKIADQSGVGGQLGENITFEIDNEEKLTVLEAFNSVEIVTGSDKFDYEIKNGKLVIYMLTENKFVDGDLRLTVEQFTSSNQIAKYKGTVTIASNKEGTWK